MTHKVFRIGLSPKTSSKSQKKHIYVKNKWAEIQVGRYKVLTIVIKVNF